MSIPYFILVFFKTCKSAEYMFGVRFGFFGSWYLQVIYRFVMQDFKLTGHTKVYVEDI